MIYWMLRGGSWNRSAAFVRVADRNWRWPGYRNLDLGFRLILEDLP